MIKLFFLMMFFFASSYSLKADQAPMADNRLDNVRNPFGNDISNRVPIVAQPIQQEVAKPIYVKPGSKPVALPVISLPELHLQGVIVGEDMHQAIINDQAVPLFGIIKGAKVVSVTKRGVGLLFKGKKFFLKID